MTISNRREQVADTLSSGTRFITLGGVETYLIFQQKFPLREFAAYEVYANAEAYAELQRKHMKPIADSARRHGFGLLLDCFAYKASPDFVARLGYGPDDMERLNRNAVEHMAAFKASCQPGATFPIVLSADLGPRGDGYGIGDGAPPPTEVARDYHRKQLSVLAETDVDFATAYSMTNVSEAIGMTLAARDCGLPFSVSPTVETDGCLPDGTPLGDFIRRVDDATDGYPIFYQVNCAHPLHLAPTVKAAKAANEPWLARFKGLRANASSKSHADLDESPTLERGDPMDLGRRVAELERLHPLFILGGCCGTDAEHMSAIAAACA